MGTRRIPRQLISVAHSGTPLYIKIMEDVQRFFANRISGMFDLSYCDILTALTIQSLHRRREWYIIIHTWKTITGYVPNALDMQFVESRRFGIQAKKLLFPP